MFRSNLLKLKVLCKNLYPKNQYHTVKTLCENNSFYKFTQPNKNQIRRSISSDVVVIGGGAMGASTAYWLKEKADKTKNMRVIVIEKDPTYTKCSTALSVGGVRQQFSLPENIQMSLFGAEFIENIKKRFGPEADISYTPNGYLLVASAKGAEQFISSFNLQQELGASNQLLTKNQLKERFPWMNVDDIELGCLGGQKEGWFDPWSLLNLLKSGAINKGAQFIQGEVCSFVFRENQTLQGVEVKLPNGEKEKILFEQCVLAAGAESGKIARMAKIGDGPGILSVPLNVERRKRFVYRFDSQGTNRPLLSTPLLIDYTGAYFRRDGDCYIGGLSPEPHEEPKTDDLEVDYDFFNNRVWPLLAARVPAFESIKLKGAWAGFYEYNCFDCNGIIGSHPHYMNLYFATGFSGHGIQQSPATGLAIAELIIDGKFKTIDLSRMGFDRFITNKPVYEIGIY